MTGLDLSDPELLDVLDWAEADIYPSEMDGLGLLTVRSVSPVPAAVDFVLDAVTHLSTVVTGLSIEGLDQDLVGATDIAVRVGVSREMARLWTTGARGPGNFPSPLGMVNGGRRVWDWASVNAWLLASTDHGQPETGLSRAEYARIEALLRCRTLPALAGSWVGSAPLSVFDASFATAWASARARRLPTPTPSPAAHRLHVWLELSGAHTEEQVLRWRPAPA